MRLFLSSAAMVAAFLVLPSEQAIAHSGGLNSEGCHTNRKTGEYHCHRSPAPRPTGAGSPAPANTAFGGTNNQPSNRQTSGRAFRNCDEARAAGAAPVRRGEPGYGPHLDRDNDGVGCEPYRGR